ncbi:MAG: glycosyltransferase family 2 protein [Acidobacteriia bacterium]|nr:glycosyltransferase family 2 protein [Terriglobia bacterium]
MPPISATIITRNEAAHIARALRSLAGADEIVVVDAESTDDTRQIAAEMGARVIIRPWDGFASQKNYAAEQARHDWVLSLFKLRLFDRQRGRWEGEFVHESVAVSGRVETLSGEILHYTCDSLREHGERIEFYTDLAAQEMFAHGERVSLLRRGLAPPWVFFSTYFLRLGVLDGPQGFLIAWMAARYVQRKYQKWAQLREEQKSEVRSQKSGGQTPDV